MGNIKNFGMGSISLIMLILFGCNNPTENSKLMLKSEFIYQANEVPFPSCHASTIAETPEGLVAAWFGGTHEKHMDVGIWLSREVDGEWTTPVEVVNGIQNDELRYPTWNPVLFYTSDKLLLFYKVGPDCSYWWGEMMTSDDFGVSWSEQQRLPDSIWGPIRNKPVLLASGELLCPSSTEYDGWRVHMESTNDLGKTWSRTEALNDGDSLDAIQPTILTHPNNKLQILCRTKSNKIYSSWSSDNGNTWSELNPINLPNNNSGIDAVTLTDGRHLLVYNHIDRSLKQGKRNLLNLAISMDGINWEAVGLLENDDNIEHEYSYPAIIQTNDGLVHIIYTWRRELIKHIVIDPARIVSTPMDNGNWPENIN
ncbi:MAG: exo-alpha-sialidase [Bacteroidales bacterium]|nr:exo-alpha-sialidase [Bacteroidales bacterium]MCF8391298.1 exo-alpha-sialidase [Bacteroidales bacterium]